MADPPKYYGNSYPPAGFLGTPHYISPRADSPYRYPYFGPEGPRPSAPPQYPNPGIYPYVSHEYPPHHLKPFQEPRSGLYARGSEAYYWVDTFARSGIVPSTALHGGYDIDGTQIYVGRAFHEGDWIPAKVIPEKQVAYVAYGGAEHIKDHYQILCEQRFDWVPSCGGHIPQGAVEGGKTSDGETLYIGRVRHDGALSVGKVQPSHAVCYVPFNGREDAHSSYEVLVLRS
ncbi:uncharacterized protein [Euwallacea fornicatus]|uniref:uncharacterized protein n=1 Tax=Euwallacea fornicatus TaxID=995702 RepID=UPI00338F06A2